MNYLADMMKQAMPNMPRLQQRLQQPGFGQPPMQHGTFTGAYQPPMQQPEIPRQPVQNHQYNPPAWANNAGQAEQPPQWGAFQPPRMGGGMRGGYFDGNLGQPDPWRAWGGWGG